MFKARKRNPKQKLRRKEDEDESNHTQDASSKTSQDDEENGTAATIALVKKKRKLLTDLQYKKGTDVVTLLKGRDYSNHNMSVDDTSVRDSATASSSQEGVMEQKHKQALEQFVEAKLVGMLGGDAAVAAAVTAVIQSEPSNTMNSDNSNNLTQEELYRQLAQASENLVGRSTQETSQGGDGVATDGDVGAGGAMLVAGTGLAEVILPVEERLKAAAATEEAAVGWKGPYKSKTYYGMPQSQVPIPAGAARFQVSGADRHRHYANNNSSTDTALSQPTPAEHNNDQGRLGFDAARGKAATAGGNNHATNSVSQTKSNNTGNTSTKASDDKVYGNFLKHHRENQWRGR
jgi:hypothetical protein